MKNSRYTIEDLCELTGYSRRTIRYYIQEGLVKPPHGRGRGGFYFDSHLKRLLQIKGLQDRGFRLSAIREILNLKERGEEEESLNREVWIRYPIAEGIEVHVSRALEERQRKGLAEIIRLARSILKQEEL